MSDRAKGLGSIKSKYLRKWSVPHTDQAEFRHYVKYSQNIQLWPVAATGISNQFDTRVSKVEPE